MGKATGIGIGRNVQPGLRAACARGQHTRCVASRCNCFCHRAFKSFLVGGKAPNPRATSSGTARKSGAQTRKTVDVAGEPQAAR